MSATAQHSRHKKPPISVELAAQAAIALVKGDGQRKVAKEFGISRRDLPPLRCVAEHEAAKLASMVHGQLMQIENGLLVNLQEKLEKISPSQLPLAFAIIHDKRLALESRRAPNPRQTIVINGLTRADALKFLTGGSQYQSQPQAVLPPAPILAQEALLESIEPADVSNGPASWDEPEA